MDNLAKVILYALNKNRGSLTVQEICDYLISEKIFLPGEDINHIIQNRLTWLTMQYPDSFSNKYDKEPYRFYLRRPIPDKLKITGAILSEVNYRSPNNKASQKQFGKFFQGLIDLMIDRISDCNYVTNILYDGISKPLTGNLLYTCENPEEFTRRHIIEPILEMLGYTDILYETKFKIKKYGYVDYAIRIPYYSLPANYYIFIEAKPLGTNLETEARLQMNNYLTSANFTFGIITDGLIWKIVPKMQYELLLKPSWTKLYQQYSYDLSPIFKWAYFVQYDDIKTTFPTECLNEFIDAFHISKLMQTMEKFKEELNQKQNAVKTKKTKH